MKRGLVGHGRSGLAGMGMAACCALAFAASWPGVQVAMAGPVLEPPHPFPGSVTPALKAHAGSQSGPGDASAAGRKDRPDDGTSPLLAAPMNALKRKAPGNRSAKDEPASVQAPAGADSAPLVGLDADLRASQSDAGPAPADPPGYAYHPEGRRDPFMAIAVGDSKAAEVNLSVPPLQRVALSEVNLIGIMWGGFGYVAMVQTPDGRGYTVREGTQVGANEGIVSAITDEALTIKEPYLDIYGKKQMREYVVLLHPRTNLE